jgi:hypothetical protein
MAIVIDMRNPKFDFYDREGALLALDTIILDQVFLFHIIVETISSLSIRIRSPG